MHIENTAIEGVKILRPAKHGDGRGFFSELYSKRRFPDPDFVQDNIALSVDAGTLRGLHYQRPPMAQAKLVTALMGSILDVVVDIRRGSATFGQHVAVVLEAAELTQLFVPAGFAHAYCTLEANTLVHYKVDNHYSPEHDAGINWDDPKLRIKWPFERSQLTLSDKDMKQPLLEDIVSPF